MKKSIGSVPAPYPLPVVAVGAMNGEEPTWMLVAHAGVPSHDRIMVSLAKSHFINGYIHSNGAMSANAVGGSWFDRAGCLSFAEAAKRAEWRGRRTAGSNTE